jgi:hypothetical protein
MFLAEEDKLLHVLEQLLVEDWLVLAFEPLIVMAGLTEIDPVFEEVGQRTVGERDSTPAFRIVVMLKDIKT